MTRRSINRPWVSDHKLYPAWAAMIQRCTNPNAKSYAHYGGRGITVCPEWRASFSHFLKDMGDRPAGASLDRIDNDAGYAPDNCRWATRSEQQLNIRATYRGKHPGVYRHRGKWEARVKRNGKTTHVGTFATLNEAVAERRAVLYTLGYE